MATSIQAADFQTGQAARAVIGQPSFSARNAGIVATALSASNGKLYAADATQRILTFDITAIPGTKDDLASNQGTTCAVCGFSPASVAKQSVSPEIAAVGVFGKTVVVADTATHRVLIWRDVSQAAASQGPDLVLRRGDPSIISATTLVDPISVAFDGKRLFIGDAVLHRVLVWNSLPADEDQPADAVLGQPNFNTVSSSDIAGPDTIDRPDALASDGSNLFVADGVSRRILVFTPAETPLSNGSITNSASFAVGPFAPGTLITISGKNLSDSTESATDDGQQPLPKKLAGVEAIFDGVPLPVLSASPTQVRAQIPYDTGNVPAASLYLRTEHSDETITITNAAAVKLTAASPGLFAFGGGTEPRGGLVLHAAPGEAGQAGSPVTPESPVRPGEIVTVWAAGLGLVNTGDPALTVLAGVPYSGPDAPVLNPVNAFINGHSAQVISAILPQGAIGVYEVQIAVPADLPPDSRAQLLLVQNGASSNTVTFPVAHAIN